MAIEYGPEFFETIREGCISSAKAVVPLVLAEYQPKTVVDIGCGEGWWGAEFAKHGCKVAGIDGAPSAPMIDDYTQTDLNDVIGAYDYDLAVCLEVAEHLPPERAPLFVDQLTLAAPVILFSAAVPGQGGHGHVNEQWPQFWIDTFAHFGYACSGALRWQIWNDDRVEPWYKMNMMVAARNPENTNSLRRWFDTPLKQMWPVIHPTTFTHRIAS